MTRLIHRVALVCVIPLLFVTLPVAAAVQPNETNLRAADAEELRNVLTGDAKAMRSLMHPNYMVNSPVNQIVRKDQLIKLLSEGKIASEAIERTIEATAITGNVGIVMGRETIIPKPNSELGLVHGVKTLERRFTNVFVFEQGNWRLLARQSTVIQASPQWIVLAPARHIGDVVAKLSGPVIQSCADDLELLRSGDLAFTDADGPLQTTR